MATGDALDLMIDSPLFHAGPDQPRQGVRRTGRSPYTGDQVPHDGARSAAITPDVDDRRSMIPLPTVCATCSGNHEEMKLKKRPRPPPSGGSGLRVETMVAM